MKFDKDCPKCKSSNTTMNRAGTIFCDDCYICTSRVGKPERMLEHPLYEKFGWKIKKNDLDANEYNFSISKTSVRVK